MSNQLLGGAPTQSVAIAGAPTKDNRGTGRLDSGVLDEGTLDDTQYGYGDGFDPPTPGDNLD